MAKETKEVTLSFPCSPNLESLTVVFSEGLHILLAAETGRWKVDKVEVSEKLDGMVVIHMSRYLSTDFGGILKSVVRMTGACCIARILGLEDCFEKLLEDVAS